MATLVDLIGKRFGRLTVIEYARKNKWGKSLWLCICDDGNEIIVLGSSLKSGNTKSCGCLNIEKTKRRFTKHGHWGDEIYKPWAAMIQRCTNPNHPGYMNWGGRGITVCERWMKFENFLEDMINGWKPGLTLERDRNELGYFPKNCYWATYTEQNRNTRRNHLITYRGKTQCIAVWAEEYNILYDTLWGRLYRYGWSVERALTTPVRKCKKRKK